MKYFLLPIAVAFTGTAVAQGPFPAKGTIPAQRLKELRLAIEQSRAAATSGPRQLTPEQLAELRRQIKQQQQRETSKP